MGRIDVCESAQHRILAARHAGFDIGKHRLHRIALQAVLRTAEIARDDREFHGLGKARQVVLGAVGERPQHKKIALVVEQLCRHSGKAAAVEEIHEEGFEDILAVMPENQRVAALLPGDAVEVAASEPGTERAVGRPFGHLLLHNGIGVAILDPMRHADRAQVIRKDVLGEIRLALVEIAGDEFHRQQAPPLEVHEDRQQRIGILASRQPDQPAALPVEHPEVFERLANQPQKPLPELVEADRLRRIGKERGKLSLARHIQLLVNRAGKSHTVSNIQKAAALRRRAPRRLRRLLPAPWNRPDRPPGPCPAVRRRPCRRGQPTRSARDPPR